MNLCRLLVCIAEEDVLAAYTYYRSTILLYHIEKYYQNITHMKLYMPKKLDANWLSESMQGMETYPSFNIQH